MLWFLVDLTESPGEISVFHRDVHGLFCACLASSMFAEHFMAFSVYVLFLSANCAPPQVCRHVPTQVSPPGCPAPSTGPAQSWWSYSFNNSVNESSSTG